MSEPRPFDPVEHQPEFCLLVSHTRLEVAPALNTAKANARHYATIDDPVRIYRCVLVGTVEAKAEFVGVQS